MQLGCFTETTIMALKFRLKANSGRYLDKQERNTLLGIIANSSGRNLLTATKPHFRPVINATFFNEAVSSQMHLINPGVDTAVVISAIAGEQRNTHLFLSGWPFMRMEDNFYKSPFCKSSSPKLVFARW